MNSIRINRVVNEGRYGISRGNGSGNMMLGPGIHDPLCGWDWLLSREHPQEEIRFSATINPEAKNRNIVRDLSRAAMGKA